MQKLLRARCVLLGSKSCGKSSIIQSFRDDGREFSYNYRMSATVELIVKTLTVPELSDGIELFLYDIPGEEIFRDFMEHYTNRFNLVIVIFDVTDNESFTSAKLTLTEFMKSVLVGNKMDLKMRRSVDKEKAQKLADGLNIPYFETSAKEAVGIDAIFSYLIQQYYQLYTDAAQHYKSLV
ncbi:Intraflagellar transport protein 27 like [Schistosoma japonicum]|nr:Intraflagellar transport protein 27 like [Schistosoma japonicum]